MSKLTNIFELEFGDFQIVFDLDIQRSVEYSSVFALGRRDFFFAVVLTWVKIGGAKTLIDAAEFPGNFLEDSKFLEEAIASPGLICNGERIFEPGGWWNWMKGYWSRIEHDSATEEDERKYDEMFRASAWNSDNGDIAIYKYGENHILEIFARTSEYPERSHAWVIFDNRSILSRLRQIRSAIEDALSKARGHQPD
ncbi:MAG TPA: hypothetical protein VGC21_23075 [Telluria sp.]|jgi:hypothetical protein